MISLVLMTAKGEQAESVEIATAAVQTWMTVDNLWMEEIMDSPSILSTLLIVLFIAVPVLLILINLDRARKRNDEMRELQKETNRLLAEIASVLKNGH